PESNGNSHGPQVGTRDLSHSRIERNGLTPGTPAPPFRLPALDGREIGLDDFRGKPLLLVFSDPHCGPCDVLMPRLQELVLRRDARPQRANVGAARSSSKSEVRMMASSSWSSSSISDPEPNLQVLVVSRGELAENQEEVARHALTFPIVLQKKWEISRLYGMFATPLGYLIDEEGISAAPVAAGPEAILAQAREHRNPSRDRLDTLAGTASMNGG